MICALISISIVIEIFIVCNIVTASLPLCGVYILMKVVLTFIIHITGTVSDTSMYSLQAMCEDSDIKEMGIPMGPRKKLQGYVRDLKQKQVKQTRLTALYIHMCLFFFSCFHWCCLYDLFTNHFVISQAVLQMPKKD